MFSSLQAGCVGCIWFLSISILSSTGIKMIDWLPDTVTSGNINIKNEAF